jgi:hypothetical protein
MAVRILKVVGLLLGVGLLVSPTWSPIPGTVCGWAGPQAGEAWYGPPVLTTAQTLDLMEKFAAPEGEKCRLVAGVSLHFGDYEKVFTEAFPILRQYQVPATAFIVTGRIGQPDYMTLDQIKELAKNGWEIGSHTVTHRPLVEPSLEQVGSAPARSARSSNSRRPSWSARGFLSLVFSAPLGSMTMPSWSRSSGSMGIIGRMYLAPSTRCPRLTMALAAGGSSFTSK